MCSDRTKSNGFKLSKDSFGLDIRKKCFSVRMVKDWYRLLREVVGVPGSVQARLGRALSSMSLPMAGSWS